MINKNTGYVYDFAAEGEMKRRLLFLSCLHFHLFVTTVGQEFLAGTFVSSVQSRK